MRASHLVGIAFVLLVIGRWANDKSAITWQGAAGMAVLIVTVSALDGGKTEPIAKGFAWLILAAVILNKDDPLNGLVKAVNTAASPSRPKAV